MTPHTRLRSKAIPSYLVTTDPKLPVGSDAPRVGLAVPHPQPGPRWRGGLLSPRIDNSAPGTAASDVWLQQATQIGNPNP